MRGLLGRVSRHRGGPSRPKSQSPGSLPGASAKLCMARRYAHPRRSDANVIPEGPGHAARPRSKFTFLNYLKSKNRLVSFTNLSTFLPWREEFNDYLAWCASHSRHCVRYGREAVSVSPVKDDGASGVIELWHVRSRDVVTPGKTNGDCKACDYRQRWGGKTPACFPKRAVE